MIPFGTSTFTDDTASEWVGPKSMISVQYRYYVFDARCT